jgi:hypothetical protein
MNGGTAERVYLGADEQEGENPSCCNPSSGGQRADLYGKTPESPASDPSSLSPWCCSRGQVELLQRFGIRIANLGPQSPVFKPLILIGSALHFHDKRTSVYLERVGMTQLGRRRYHPRANPARGGLYLSRIVPAIRASGSCPSRPWAEARFAIHISSAA